MCALSGGDVRTAYRYARLGADEPAADGAVWTVRFTLALANAEPEDAARSFHVIAQRFPAAIGELDDSLILTAYQSLGTVRSPESERLRFLDALSALRWTPNDPANDAASLRLERVRLLLAAGRTEEAAVEAAALRDPYAQLSLQIDDRFAPVRGSQAGDLQAVARERLSALTVVAAASPERLSALVAMAELHLALGEPDRALALLNAAFERRRRGGPDAFVDDDAHLNWARDVRAQALLALGRWDDALEALAEAAGTPEDGGANFSQTMNLAGALTFAGRPDEALATLDAVNEAGLTDDGRAWVQASRACALAASKDQAGATQAAARTDELGPRNFPARVHARLCLDDLEAAARLYIARLRRPEDRLEALLALQTYRNDPTVEAREPSGWGAKRRTQLAELRARPDIQAAAARVGGRIGRVELVDVSGRL